ncbi:MULTISPECIES: hypothetical protein [Vibrio]|uniref:hypothetical protein n=1 Tax=Vibrio TaxID=662 RepID=UPI0002F7E9E7|nr:MULTISPECIES: hypothetical protein [Vibrio]ERM61351.1 hypothetical protein M565_ctg1P1543 [Vibrio cyclitrophicus FF75]KAA8599528.1 hypothetical protein F0Z19_2653 [Vibrio cyclitrophicus]MBE8558827.1 hypothetical protein [Vibrio sp. OPT24]MBE8605501.1 hypothetical protein [Vibrio sp. OPT10]MBU2933964.1 hypothetical protein [Vibrio cyclitrophicus]
MDTLLLKIRDMILATRQQWIGEITYNHNIKGENTWKLYGYNSHEEYKKDLRNSLREES